MLKTGNDFIDLFSLTVVFLPLLPVAIVLARKIYTLDVLTFLMILCLLNFARGLTLQTIEVTRLNQISVHNVFALLEMIILAQIFKTSLSAFAKGWVNILSIGLLSSLITLLLLRGAGEKNPGVEGLLDGFILALTIYSLTSAVRKSNLQVFHSALFWVATGTLFYYATAFLLEASEFCCLPSGRSVATEKILLLDMAELARYFFYTLACCLWRRPARTRVNVSQLDS
jgi:hypothetical protein